MHADYDPSLAAALAAEDCTETSGGLTVHIKHVPDAPWPGFDPRELDGVKALTARLAAAPAGKPTIAQQRAQMGGVNYNLNRAEIHTRYLEVPTTAGPVPVWVCFPRDLTGAHPALLYVHGGAFRAGTPFHVENACRLIAERADCPVFNIDYSLPPEHPCPIPAIQVYEVLCWVHAHAHEFRADADRLVMAGDSAGGNLTAVCAQADNDRNTHYLRAQVLLYAKLLFLNDALPGYVRDLSVIRMAPEQAHLLPFCTMIGSDEANAGDAEVYLQGRYTGTEPFVSPMLGRLEGLPRTLLLLAEYDGLRLEGEHYAKLLLAAGVPCRVVRYCGVCHGFFDELGIVPQAEAAADEIAALLRSL